jgi:WD40 repeat protein
VAFLVDGKHIVSGGAEQQIRRWRVDDGMEVATPIMDAGSPVRGVVATRDGKWVVSGTSRGVVVWNAKTREKVSEFKGQGAAAVCAVDVSPGSTRIATGSEDGTVGVWSL